MIRVSKRLLSVPESPIRKLAPYAMTAKKRGIKIYHLNIGDPDIKTPDVMLDELKKWSGNPICYGQSQGEPVFLKALQAYYRRIGFSFVQTSDIQVTTGGSEAIAMALFSVCESGDEVLTFEPFYANYSSYAAVNQVKVIPIPTDPSKGFHLPPGSEIEKKITKRTKAILYCNPNNPTGTVYAKKEIEMLVGIAKKYNIFLICDEAYREFTYDNREHVSILSYFRDIPRQAILLDSLSKRYSLCGLRLGVLISLNKDVMSGVLRIAQGRLSSGLIDQVVASKLTKVSSSYFRQTNKEYKKRRDLLYAGLKTIPGVSLSKPEGAFYAIASLPVKDAEEFCKFLLRDFQHDGKTIMLAPAAGFYATPGLGKDQVRIAYVLSCEDLRVSIDILAKALTEYPDHSMNKKLYLK